MRSKKEVETEIEWREKEIESIKAEIKNKTFKQQDLEYMQSRLINLNFALTWCKWFLNKK